MLCLDNLKILTFLFGFFLITDPKLQNSQPTVPMFGFNSYGGDRYAVINDKMSWEEAQKNCRDQFAELASVLDPYAESYLWLQMLKHGEPVWIGLNSNMVSPSNACDSCTATLDQHRSAIFLAQRLTGCSHVSAISQICECVAGIKTMLPSTSGVLHI